MKLVRFVCAAKAHAGGGSDAALTIHDGAWAFCGKGADAPGHEWVPSDGLPIMDAMRFPPRQPMGEASSPEAPTRASAAPNGRASSR
jgi:hypothetical protein